MKVILSAILACIVTEYVSANLGQQGFIADTPEVAAAKIAHFAEVSKALAAASPASNVYSQDYNNNNNNNGFSVSQNSQGGYTYRLGSASSNSYAPSATNYYTPSQITVQPNGYLADTPEVAAAKAAHFAEFAKAGYSADAPTAYSTNSYAQSPANNYYNPSSANNYYTPAQITVQPNGYLADTPEVAAAKASFFSEYAKAGYSADAPTAFSAYSYAPLSANNYYTPSQITVQPNGYLADTPEVAAAKAAFFSEYAKAGYSADNSVYNPSSANNYYNPSSANNYYEPAQITVQPNGFLADTPEVAQAKAYHFSEKAKAAANNGVNQYYQ